ncbi:RNA 2',3'-cyclic phosphodiesterase [Sporosarcina sp.]|uniref:RNA 2',3'-cyclic phosphodiesterase n=1 Tax=Sporosarcina sp. TaxID=49982 RepID=UPI00261F9A35|nr:RNA 2',3'-cyclic phosphodiesterase [Sporosarcina sp.]
MAQHYFIGISIAAPAFKLAEQFRAKYMLYEKYKVLPNKDDLHITMRYIGEMDENRTDTLISSLHKIANDHTNFNTSITGLKFFGSSSGPRVVYLSVDKVNALCNLQIQIARRTEKILGLEKDHPFVPHITIAKKRKTTDKMELTTEKITPVNIQINGFTLFKIHPNIKPSYEPIEYFPLKKS